MIRTMLDTISGMLHGFDDSVFKQVASEVGYTKEEIDSKLASGGLKIKGVVETASELPTSDNAYGDVWGVRADNKAYVWISTEPTGDNWQQLCSLVDLSSYYTKSEIDQSLGDIPDGRSVMDMIGSDIPADKSLMQIISGIEPGGGGGEQPNTHHEVTSFDDLPTEGNVNGDTGVVKTLISDGKYSYTAYVWDNDRWTAMDGNYSADNVIFDEDIALAGDYTQVGNVKISAGSIAAHGKSVKDVFQEIFDKTVQPTLGAAPTARITLSNAGAYEVGTTVTPSYTCVFTQGKYNCPWNSSTVNDGTSANAWSIKDNAGNTATTQSGAFPARKVTDNSTYNTSVTAQYSSGTVAKDNKGNDSNPVVRRASGTTAAATSSSITGYRNIYIGSLASDVEITESVLKSLTKFRCTAITKTLKASGGDIPLVAGAVKVVVAIPTGSGKTSCGGYALTQVLLASASNTPITSDYQLGSNVQVSGAVAEEDLKDYKVYVYQPASIDPGEVHTIKIS